MLCSTLCIQSSFQCSTIITQTVRIRVVLFCGISWWIFKLFRARMVRWNSTSKKKCRPFWQQRNPWNQKAILNHPPLEKISLSDMETDKLSERTRRGEELLGREDEARNKSQHNLFWFFLVNGYSSFAVFLTHLISVRTVSLRCCSLPSLSYVEFTARRSFQYLCQCCADSVSARNNRR